MAVTLSAFFTPREISGTHFCQRISLPQGHALMRLKVLSQLKNPSALSAIETPTFGLVTK
jgi:hypothetical protein